MKKLVAGNWKLNNDNKCFEQFKNYREENFREIESFIAVPYLYVYTAIENFPSYISVGCQNISQYDKGAYTGEISGHMLKECMVTYVIIGHSERRTMFYEDDEVISIKVKMAMKSKLKIVLCVGEDAEIRKSGKYLDHIFQQLSKGVSKIEERNLDVAYEPLWAIGTGVSASVEEIIEVVENISKWMKELKIVGRILYGGSVSKIVSKDICNIKSLGGVLVGNASLKEEFQEIAKIFSESCH